LLVRIFILIGAFLLPGFPEFADAKEKSPKIHDYPHYILERGDLRLMVVDLLSPNGYYPGQRFAKSAMIAQAFWRDIPIFAEFTANKTPTSHDHVSGNAEEFDLNGPQSFPSQAGAAPFLKIGVGLLRRLPDGLEKSYRFNEKYGG
jgi:hypothetical protein